MRHPPSFRTVRWLRTLNLVAQAVLLLSFFWGLNYLAQHHGWRFDLTARHRHSLSLETRAYLDELTQPVRVIVTFSDDTNDAQVTQARRDVSELLQEYFHATEHKDKNPAGTVTPTFLNVYQRPAEAKALGLDQPNTILVLAGEGQSARRRVVGFDELYRVENRERKAFLGEQALTAAILDVSSPNRKKIYFLTGHGELSLDDVSPDRGLSGLADELRLRNFALDTLYLSTSRAIPSDAALLVIAGPQGRYSAAEAELLRQYLGTRAGRLLLLLPPEIPSQGLDDLLDDWGLLADDVLVCDSGPASQNDNGDLIFTAAAKSIHPVIATLSSNKIPVRFGSARSVRPDPGRRLDPSLVISPLIGSASSAWGERSYRDRGTPTFNSGIDLPGPFPVVTAAERVTTRGDLPFSVPGGRVVAFGSADWITNGRYPALGNFSLFLAAVNWTADRDLKLANVPVRPVERLQLVLNTEQLRRLRYSLIFALPGAAALLGLAVWWSRRR
jgi:ABC-type uncharacterized transport system involved in gliding motility auxiliary subunit